tara:strand:+ start:679 stop:1539 length:861 start_codon:yes stop_codon:yes gene_type:complete
LFGKTRHAWYDHLWRETEASLKEEIILQEVKELRKQVPRIGTRKLHFMLQQRLACHDISIGRDYLFDLLRDHHLLVRQRKRKAYTTDSRHWMRKYDNLITGLSLNHPEQLWVSDITYIRLNNQWGYLSLITDAFSRKIMGYGFRTDLSVEGCLEALKMAMENRIYPCQPLIHHSDRGSQYCSQGYTGLLIKNNIAISMTQNGDPYENALAERVNGIIKTEFNLNDSNKGFQETKQKIHLAIEAYNTIRPHASCNYLTPDQAHKTKGKLTKKWKNYPYNRNNLNGNV